jgi:Na+/H+ antiporter NhaD/arsenite permease-like protein
MFCLLTFVLAAFLDNIAVILVIVPLTLRLAKDLRFDPKPLVIGEIISSNLGGASTMIGDFPNLLIALSTKLQFMDFIMYLAPCCILLLFAMFIFMRLFHHDFFTMPIKNHTGDDTENGLGFRNSTWIKPVTNPRAVTQALIILGIVTIGIIFSAQAAGIFTLAGGLILLIAGGIPRKNIIAHGGWGDVLFFASLFIVVGAFEASGLLYYLAHSVVLQLTNGNLLAISIAILSFSAIITAFMNAGPTTALFIPVVLHLNIQTPDNLIWWALSLGVLCGSSASLYGASGGPLASTLMAKYWKKIRKQVQAEPSFANLTETLDMREYLKTGVPVGGIFLAISIAYISLIYFYF